MRGPVAIVLLRVSAPLGCIHPLRTVMITTLNTKNNEMLGDFLQDDSNLWYSCHQWNVQFPSPHAPNAGDISAPRCHVADSAH